LELRKEFHYISSGSALLKFHVSINEGDEIDMVYIQEYTAESKDKCSIFENFMDLIKEGEPISKQIPTLRKPIKTIPNHITLKRKNGSSSVIIKKAMLQIQSIINQSGVV
jgi:hypothetical protein